jgi:hypothetical protein
VPPANRPTNTCVRRSVRNYCHAINARGTQFFTGGPSDVPRRTPNFEPRTQNIESELRTKNPEPRTEPEHEPGSENPEA